MTIALLDHLWQSTLFAMFAGLATLGFRNNGAEVRYGLWLAASMKFLFPFALLTMFGGALLIPLHPDPRISPFFCDLQPAIQPFLTRAEMAPAAAHAAKSVPLGAILLSVWIAGLVAVLALWATRWHGLRKILRDAVDAGIEAPLPVKYAAGFPEPGLVGICRPVLLLPQGITARLSPQEIQAIIAHELCHWRRRDNLTAALHMIVEAVFWFHPLVWWLGARLIEERERACDEAVLRAGADPETYARGILKVCKFYLRSPLASASGVSGADLMRRMNAIMSEKLISRLTLAKKAALGAASLATIAAPLAVGLIESRLASAQTIPAAGQAAPSSLTGAISIDPGLFDKYAGDYRLPGGAVLHVSRDGGRYFLQESSARPVEIFAQGDSTFLARSTPTQVSFDLDAAGKPARAILRQGGHAYDARRIVEPSAAPSDLLTGRRRQTP